MEPLRLEIDMNDSITAKVSSNIEGLDSEKLFIRYLNLIRKQLETNGIARRTAAKADPASQAKAELIELLNDMIIPGSMEIFERAMDEILSELDQLRKLDVGLVLINEQTGKSIIPFTEEMIYTPPDYVGADGQLRKSKPILHPGISSTLGMIAYEAEKKQEILKKAQKPNSYHAYTHLINEQMIAVYASQRLANIGLSMRDDLPVDGIDIEFGREHIDASEQSINLKCHRAYMYAAILATKILQKFGYNGICSLGMVHQRKNAKQRWYTVEVKFMETSAPIH